MKAAATLCAGLRDLGLMKGAVEDAVQAGAHALFFPHGLGHMLGLAVHDMESLGEDHVGYDRETPRSHQFGLSALRLGRRLEVDFVVTVEPGIYFIPALIDQWRQDSRWADFIDFEKLAAYRRFGGIRIEDDVLDIEVTHAEHAKTGFADDGKSFIKQPIEQGATVLAYSSLRRAAAMVGSGNLFFVVFAENRFILDLLVEWFDAWSPDLLRDPDQERDQRHVEEVQAVEDRAH